ASGLSGPAGRGSPLHEGWGSGGNQRCREERGSEVLLRLGMRILLVGARARVVALDRAALAVGHAEQADIIKSRGLDHPGTLFFVGLPISCNRMSLERAQAKLSRPAQARGGLAQSENARSRRSDVFRRLPRSRRRLRAPSW